jgi:hypothetical protein
VDPCNCLMDSAALISAASRSIESALLAVERVGTGGSLTGDEEVYVALGQCADMSSYCRDSSSETML